MKYDCRCSYCGKFINFEDPEAVVRTPYGGPLDLEPPDEEYICGKCWTNRANQNLVNEISWRKPMKLIDI